MCFFPNQIIFIGSQPIPILFKDPGRLSLDRIVTPRHFLTLSVVFTPAFMVRITSGSGIAHLDKFSCHVHANKIIRLAIIFKELIDFFGGLASRMDASSLDLILVEGFKHEEVPKILLYREGISHSFEELKIDSHVIAVACDISVNALQIPVLDINSPNEIADFIKNWLQK